MSGSVVAVVIGLAGGARALNDEDYARAVLADGVAVPARIVSDVNVAFSSATPAEEGYAMIAGTGAVAGRVTGSEVGDRRDGWGWLVGDRGSGFWLGRAAVQSTLQRLDDGGPLSGLHEAVLTAVGADLDQGRDVASRELVRACYAEPPIRLARLAPLVSEHAPTDPVAAALADRAAELLTATLLSLRPEPGLPVVLGGSVLSTPGPISDRVRSEDRPPAQSGADRLLRSGRGHLAGGAEPGSGRSGDPPATAGDGDTEYDGATEHDGARHRLVDHATLLLQVTSRSLVGDRG